MIHVFFCLLSYVLATSKVISRRDTWSTNKALEVFLILANFISGFLNVIITKCRKIPKYDVRLDLGYIYKGYFGIPI